MRGIARVLVIGSGTLGAAVADALPRCQTVTAETPLSGLWTAGQSHFDAIIMALGAGQDVSRVLRSLREVSPHSRIIVTCVPAQEPRAREATRAGADDYIIEPVAPESLRAALGEPAQPRYAVPEVRLPPLHEILQLSDVLKNLGQGMQATLERLAGMLRGAFLAEGVSIQAQELTATSGRVEVPVLQEPLRCQDEVIGTVTLGKSGHAAYSPADAARLADYARLIETIIAHTREQAHWQELAWRDDLSGLRNRRFFEQSLDELIRQAAARRQRVTVVLFDIDDFKTYNDAYGHETGDALIREVATLLTRCSRAQDVVARYGGDEFGVILWDAEQPRVPGSQHPTDALALAERFGAVIRNHAFRCLGPGAPGPVTLSGGLACFPWDGSTRAEIMRAADAALLAAKRSGKNHIVLAEKTAAPQGVPPPPA